MVDTSPGTAFDQDHTRHVRIDPPVVVLEGSPRELLQLPGHFHAGRTTTDHHEGHEGAATLLVVFRFRLFERAEDLSAQIERIVEGFHARRRPAEFVMPVVRGHRAGGHNQAVVADVDLAAAELSGGDGVGHRIDVGHFAEHDVRRRIMAQDVADRWRNLAFGEYSGRHLIEQRLKQMVVRAVDHREIAPGLGEAPWRRTGPRTPSR